MRIVLEGIDGCGKDTQVREIRRRFGFPVVKFPDYRARYGGVIRRVLRGELELPGDSVFFLNLENMRSRLPFPDPVVFNRYVTSAFAYNLENLSVAEAAEIAERAGLPRPDLVILIDVSVEVSAERKGEDSYERNADLLRRARKRYLKMAGEGVFGKWAVVNGEREPEEVRAEIFRIIQDTISPPPGGRSL